MAKFTIMTPVPGWTGSVGAAGTETHFVNGRAELDVVDMTSAGRLAYFRTAGYRIDGTDDVTVDEAIRRVTMTPVEEYGALKRESAELDRAAELDKLRAEVADKRKRTADVTEGDTPTEVTGGSEVTGDGTGRVLLPVPPDSDKVADWRAYAVAHLGVTESQAKTMNTAELRAEYQRAVDTKGGAR